MRDFRSRFLSDRAGQPLRILDLGSTEMGACYRPIFDDPAWRYIGADLTPGPNVDLVIKRPYAWREIGSRSIDVLVSGQVLEHVEYFWLTMLEISRVLKPGGLVCIIVPSSGPEHRYPLDCWRFYTDGMRALARFAHLEIVETRTNWADSGDPGSDLWHDSILIARKPERPLMRDIAMRLIQAMQRSLLRVRLPQ